MAILLNTGTISQSSPSSNETASPVYDDTPSERVVYPTGTEQLIRVLPSQVVVITAYGLSASDRVQIDKLLVSNSIPPSSSTVCNKAIKSADRAILNRVPLPMYDLCLNAPVTVLGMQGVYAVRVVGDEEGAVVVTATEQFNSGPYPTFPCISCCGEK